MKILKSKKRKFDVITGSDKIAETIDTYIDLARLRIKDPQKKSPVQFIERSAPDELILRLAEYPAAQELFLYTAASRYIELELVIIALMPAPFPENSFRCTIMSCSVAEDRRAHDRIGLSYNEITTDALIMSEVRERDIDLSGTVSFKVLLKQSEKNFKYTYSRIFFKNDPDIPAEVLYVITTRTMLYIKNFSDIQKFFLQNDDFFAVRADLKIS